PSGLGRPIWPAGEFQARHPGVLPGLLQPLSSRLPGGLGLHDGEREITLVPKEIIDTPGRFADETLAGREDPPIPPLPKGGKGGFSCFVVATSHVG
ncbi:MAG: hypothetical protein Q7I93_01510, partial [Syntrophales bacterium]|nr:hypothetical protein [Syntrophales bacterium]